MWLKISILRFLIDFGKVFAVAHGVTAVVAAMVVDVSAKPLSVIVLLLYTILGAFGFALLHYWASDEVVKEEKTMQSLIIHDAVKREMIYNLHERG